MRKRVNVMSYTKIAAIYADSQQLGGQTVTVGGWVRTIRDMKTFGFIELNDGSCFKNLQVVMEAGTLENYRTSPPERGRGPDRHRHGGADAGGQAASWS